MQVGRAEVLFRSIGLNGPFASAKDGKRFLTAEQDGGERGFPMLVQLNYAARLQ